MSVNVDKRGIGCVSVYGCGCVFVCDRERERVREKAREIFPITLQDKENFRGCQSYSKHFSWANYDICVCEMHVIFTAGCFCGRLTLDQINYI